MSHSYTVSLDVALLFLLAVMAVYALEALLFWWKLRKASLKQQRIIAERFQELSREIEHLKVRLAAVQNEHFRQYPDEPVEAASSSKVDQSPYTYAIQLVHSGADASEIQRVCGLARGEAELIVTLYRSAGNI